jgi:hypothetical protein
MVLTAVARLTPSSKALSFPAAETNTKCYSERFSVQNSLEGLVNRFPTLDSFALFYKALQEVHMKHSRQSALHEALYRGFPMYSASLDQVRLALEGNSCSVQRLRCK